MGKFVLKNASVTINSVDLSNHVSEVAIETTRDEVDVTSMGATMKETVAGLGDGTISVTFFQDFAASSVDATLWPLSSSDTAFNVVVKPTSGTVSSTNPQYTMSALLYSYQPISGGVAAAASTSASFRNAGTAGITRATV